MSFEFNPNEILAMAEQIERNGARFYRKAATLVKDKKVETLLLDLAEWEEGHERIFSRMRAELTERQRKSAVFDPEHEGSLYLKAMADGHVFDTRVDAADVLTGEETVEDILRQAIGQEKDSIVFYLGLKDFVAEKTSMERIDGVIKEEMRHIGFLTNQIASLSH